MGHGISRELLVRAFGVAFAFFAINSMFIDSGFIIFALPLLIFGLIFAILGEKGVHAHNTRKRSYRRNYYNDRSKINSSQDAIDYGKKGEEEVAFQLRTGLDEREYVIRNGIRIYDGENSAEIDHLVVGPTGVFAIETKHYSGKIIVDSAGNWLRERLNGTIDKLEYPRTQLRRHRNVLLSILGKECPICDIVAVAVTREDRNRIFPVEGTQNIDFNWAYSDRLVDYITGKEVVMNAADVQHVLKIIDGQIARNEDYRRRKKEQNSGFGSFFKAAGR
ncbi:nuclease-related domain-containing protein [Pelotomaculum propionicicum]|uniref:nuclease-related domain-containing protein n=1 Tax=Pelotomaculum propionicicum TaxID=258475 RepID=UPI003B78332D